VSLDNVFLSQLASDTVNLLGRLFDISGDGVVLLIAQ
jgi:hypothetical protein